jgi:hypothetical protein
VFAKTSVETLPTLHREIFLVSSTSGCHLVSFGPRGIAF